MAIELKVPSVGESITEVVIGQWLKQGGQRVAKDEALVEIETDKATLEVPAPEAGTLKVLKQAGESATVGEVIAWLEPATETPETRPAESPAPPPRVMPAAQRLLAEHGLSATQVAASGPGGRLLKEDVQRQVAAVAERGEIAVAGQQQAPTAAPRPASQPAPAREEEAVPMSPLRRLIAERLVSAQQTAALLTTFNEIDMSEVLALRQSYQEAFRERYGIRLGFMSFFVKAAIDALKLIPQLNAEIRGTDIIYKNYYDIGVAVSAKKGLVVPVVRNADRLGFAGLERAIADFGQRANDNKLLPEELHGGTFTISNGGVFGSLLSTPIVNPPQSGVLGMHAIQERPVALGGQVVIRPMMYVALTYDHRLVDGREAVTFLKRIKEAIERPARMLLEV
ncbi:MAG: 2-oxoglutarate dehydrogenase complex dihydrolipoyllysine-residue succinyltransferase [Truepera sp.]|nr:2-oxoglutarate dehydrogenase complex dihydrolipoyllysine-residue succinyltransferase [Truepera sp.]